MKEFFTADLHFGHGNIIKYCYRPFKDADHMNKRLIANINERCKPEDTLYHDGDFMCYGRARGEEGMRNKSEFYEQQIDCKVIHVMGNHDRNNTVKGSLCGAFMILGPYQIWMQHKPPWQSVDEGVNIPENVTAYVCGHVHEKFKFERWRGKPVINIGCDVWDYRPVSKDELINTIRQQLKEIKEKK
jgi:calcineurin-like phosphoesterase family protein